MRIRQRTSLGVHSATLEPGDITAALGLGPDRTQRRGQKSIDPVRPINSSWWIDAPDGPLDDQLTHLVGRIEPLGPALRRLVDETDAEAGVTIYRSFGHPDGDEEVERVIGDLVTLPGQHQLLGWHLDVGLLRRLADLGLWIDADECG